eukprot:COSAG05_NODE_2209_length_3393_cov_6.778351_4_plen_441_part_00
MSATIGEKVLSILDAGEDPLAVLRLPPPVLDALDRPTWNVEDDMIVRQFRLLSRCCHPDKNDTADAAKAFERLTNARDALMDPERRSNLVKDLGDALLMFKTRNFSGGVDAMDDMAEAARQRREEAKVLRNEEAARQAAAIRMHATDRRQRMEAALAVQKARQKPPVPPVAATTAAAAAAAHGPSSGGHGYGTDRSRDRSRNRDRDRDRSHGGRSRDRDRGSHERDRDRYRDRHRDSDRNIKRPISSVCSGDGGDTVPSTATQQTSSAVATTAKGVLLNSDPRRSKLLKLQTATAAAVQHSRDPDSSDDDKPTPAGTVCGNHALGRKKIVGVVLNCCIGVFRWRHKSWPGLDESKEGSTADNGREVALCSSSQLTKWASAPTQQLEVVRYRRCCGDFPERLSTFDGLRGGWCKDSTCTVNRRVRERAEGRQEQAPESAVA